MDINLLFDLDRRSKAFGRKHPRKRSLFHTLKEDKGRHMVGIVGPRGAGKTILLQQLAAECEDGFYLAVDTLKQGDDLFEIVRLLSERYEFKQFFVDEIHFLAGGIGALKRIYDFLELKLIFTSSVALHMHEAAYDLARRVQLHHLEYFSYREYLEFHHKESLPLLSIESLIEGAVASKYLQLGAQFSDYLYGGLLPFSLEEPNPLPLLENTIETIISKDIPQFLSLRVDELEILQRLISFVGSSEVDGINYSSLSSNLGITKYKAEQYVSAFENAFILQRLFPAGTNVLKEPKILLMPPIRSLYQSASTVRGGLREDFFVFAMRKAGFTLNYLKSTRGKKIPDFLFEYEKQKIVFEIGGKGKGREQFKNVKADRKIILAENTNFSTDKMPLHLIGFVA